MEYYRYVKLRDGFYKGLVNGLQKTGIRNWQHADS